MSIILLTSGAVLLLTCAAFFAYEFFTFRHSTLRQLSILGEIIAGNSTAALAFDNEEDAAEILGALRAERHIVAACLYDQEGRFFSGYPANLRADVFPKSPGPDGFRFETSHLAGFVSVVQGGDKRLGTLYLESDTGAMSERLRLYTSVAAAVIVVAFLAAFLLSRMLQQQISQPILALVETASAVSDRRDYSVRATGSGDDEFGLLTVAFNHMLSQIQAQNQALSESEGRVRAVIDSAMSAVLVMDVSGNIIDWNARAEQMFGWSRGEALGRELAGLVIPPRFREAHRRGMKHFIAKGEGPVLNRLIEMSALRRDGTEFPVELTISALKSGDVVTFCGFITDITERLQAHEALRSSQQMLEAIIENSIAVVYVKDAAGRYLLINRRFEEIFHFTRASVVGKTDHDLFPKQAADAFRAIDQRVLTGGAVVQAEEVAPHHDGLHTYISVKCPLFDAAGKPYAMCGISTDITDRKEAETHLQTQFGRLELLNRITRATGERQDLPSIFQVVIRSLEENLPIDFGCVFLHDAAQERLTVASVGVRSRNLAVGMELTEDAHIAVDQNGLSRCVRGQLVYEPDIASLSFPFPTRLARGGLRSLVAAPLIVESQVFGVLIAARFQPGSFSSGDCEFLRQLSEHVALATHQAQLYTALQHAYDELRETQQTVMQQERLRVLGQMASGIAHDINNAISPVALYTEVLLEKEPNLSARARGYLGTIQRAIEDVSATVARMREFYRQRETKLELARVSLNRVVQQIIDLTRARWSDQPLERGIVIELRAELPGDLPDIMGAEGEIRDALTNLIFNAVDAMPQGGTLTLRTRAVSENRQPATRDGAAFVLLDVSDTGVGMSEETKRRCFEPFFTTKGERGTGLGLAMVYGMVQRHSADIEIESEPGRGTTMRLIFPISAYITSTATTHAGPSPKPSRRLRVLAVDDDPLLIKSLRDTLESDGHVVTVADGGQPGIDAFCLVHETAERFDVVVTDLGMPYVDGRKVASAVKATSPTTPVILLTGWGQRLVAENDIPAHVDWVLNKPPKLHELRAVLAALTSG